MVGTASFRDAEVDVVNIVDTSDSENGDDGDGSMDVRRHVGRSWAGSDDRFSDSDGGLLARVDAWLHAGLQPTALSSAVPPDAPLLSQEQLFAAFH